MTKTTPRGKAGANPRSRSRQWRERDRQFYRWIVVEVASGVPAPSPEIFV